MNHSRRMLLFFGILLSVLILASLIFISVSLQDSAQFGKYYSILLASNAVGLLLLFLWIGCNVVSLAKQYSARVMGSRMTARIVLWFTVIAAVPILILYIFSIRFLHTGIDTWFDDLQVENALENSLELSRLALDIRMREILSSMQQVAEELGELPADTIALEINGMRQRLDAEEFSLHDSSGNILYSSTLDTGQLLPQRISELILLQVEQTGTYIGLDTLIRSGLAIHAVVAISDTTRLEGPQLIIQGIFPVSVRMNKLSANVQTAYVKFQELSYLHQQLKFSLVVILTLVLLFGIFSAIWFAFYLAGKLVAPVRDLADATHAVALGNYHTRLQVKSHDEMGFLVASFNDMTNRIAQARDNAHKSQQESETQHNYLKTILSRLSSGVLVLDSNLNIQEVNISALKILGIDIIDSDVSETQQLLVNPDERLQQFAQTIKEKIASDENDWRLQLSLYRNNRVRQLMLSGTKISIPEKAGNWALVIDDITALIKGQQDAAWSQVARRLAHEIKNPLTPIQLAAERIKQKYGKQANNTELLERLTQTIIKQVDSLKILVDGFSNYARTEISNIQNLNITLLLRETLDLYSGGDPAAKITANLSTDIIIEGDANRLRQVFNNMIKNALDANQQTGKNELTISCILNEEEHQVEIRIYDSGPGIKAEYQEQLFEPYFTQKHKGTGLGLAIVKKIMDEHNGRVWLENNTDGNGACAVLCLPIAASKETSAANDRPDLRRAS